MAKMPVDSIKTPIIIKLMTNYKLKVMNKRELITKLPEVVNIRMRDMISKNIAAMGKTAIKLAGGDRNPAQIITLSIKWRQLIRNAIQENLIVIMLNRRFKPNNLRVKTIRIKCINLHKGRTEGNQKMRYTKIMSKNIMLDQRKFIASQMKEVRNTFNKRNLSTKDTNLKT